MPRDTRSNTAEDAADTLLDHVPVIPLGENGIPETVHYKEMPCVCPGAPATSSERCTCVDPPAITPQESTAALRIGHDIGHWLWPARPGGGCR